MIRIFSVLPSEVSKATLVFKSDTEKITSDNDTITSDTD